jgi:hypothetical protein
MKFQQAFSTTLLPIETFLAGPACGLVSNLFRIRWCSPPHDKRLWTLPKLLRTLPNLRNPLNPRKRENLRRFPNLQRKPDREWSLLAEVSAACSPPES